MRTQAESEARNYSGALHHGVSWFPRRTQTDIHPARPAVHILPFTHVRELRRVELGAFITPHNIDLTPCIKTSKQKLNRVAMQSFVTGNLEGHASVRLAKGRTFLKTVIPAGARGSGPRFHRRPLARLRSCLRRLRIHAATAKHVTEERG